MPVLILIAAVTVALFDHPQTDTARRPSMPPVHNLDLLQREPLPGIFAKPCDGSEDIFEEHECDAL